MKASADVTVHDDQHVTVVVDVVPDRGSWTRGRGGAEIDDAVDRTVEQIGRIAPAGIEVERVDTDHSAGFRLTWSDATPEQLVAPVTFGTDANAPTLRLFQSFELAVDGDVWRLAAVVAPIGTSTRLATSDLIDDVAGSEVTLRVQMPGRVTSTNAPDHTRSSAAWVIDPALDQPTPIMMRTEPGLGLNPVWYLVSGVLILMLVGAALMVAGNRFGARRRLRRHSVSAVGSAGWDQVAGSSTVGGARAGRGPPKQRGVRRARRLAKATGVDGDGGTDRATPRGTYQDITGDDSVSLPVGGQSWGPPPHAAVSVVDGRSATVVGNVISPDVGAASPPVPCVGVQALAATPPPLPGHSTVGVATEVDSVEMDADVPSESGAAALRVTQPSWSPVVAPGWYRDPFSSAGERFWDGTDWTDHRR